MAHTTTTALASALLSSVFNDVVHLISPFIQYIVGFLIVFLALVVYYFILLATNAHDTVKLFKKIQGLPFGKWVYSFAIGVVSPYTGSIKPSIEKVDYTGATVRIKQHRFIQNPFNSVHLAALTNFGELTAALPFLAAASKAGKRAIPIAVSAEFKKKSTGTLRAISENIVVPENQDRYDVTSRIVNSKGELCATVRITFAISEPSGKKSN